ncbi:MAG: exodeoxyribonuclease VII large subunit [Planctomycetota bacterium]
MTGRLPFSAASVRRSDDGDRPLTVTALASTIDAALKKGVPGTVRVVGEVSGFRDRTHWYFDLKDEAAVVSCAMFASSARRSPTAPEDGLRVVVSGRVDWYAKGGRLSLIVTKLEPVGEGALDQELKRRVEQARDRGWLDPATKRPMPRFPRRIAVLTSRTSAGLQDILDTLRRRAPFVEVALVDVRVQGETAAAEIARAVAAVGRRADALGLDAILITRGGGSAEDLWCFNDWALAEAIAACPIPVAAAIGHETDTTLAELVADERCATPTQAAVRLSPDAGALSEQIDATSRRLGASLTTRLREQASDTDRATRALSAAVAPSLNDRLRRLDRATIRLERARPERRAAEQHERWRRRYVHALERLPRVLRATLDHASTRLRDARHDAPRLLVSRASEAGEALDGLDRELHAVNPLEVLRRGYSVTLGKDGTALRSPDAAAPGDELVTRLAEGDVRSRVSGGGPTPDPVRPAAPRSTRRRRSRRDARDQMDLFAGPE